MTTPHTDATRETAPGTRDMRSRLRDALADLYDSGFVDGHNPEKHLIPDEEISGAYERVVGLVAAWIDADNGVSETCDRHWLARRWREEMRGE